MLLCSNATFDDYRLLIREAKLITAPHYLAKAAALTAQPPIEKRFAYSTYIRHARTGGFVVRNSIIKHLQNSLKMPIIDIVLAGMIKRAQIGNPHLKHSGNLRALFIFRCLLKPSRIPRIIYHLIELWHL